jgi:predicted TIM-barrel fold metal-dependent hydrolase
METSFFANRAMWHLILSGVFDRFPNLKLVMTEQGSSWVPGVLKRMDALWERMSSGRIGEFNVPDGAVTKKTASEYFRDNVWLGASFPSPKDAECFTEIGLDKIMWGSDYPHDEGTYPSTRQSLRAAFSGWAEADLRKILALRPQSVRRSRRSPRQ